MLGHRWKNLFRNSLLSLDDPTLYPSEATGERDSLLNDDGPAGSSERPGGGKTNPHGNLPVYSTIHRMRRAIMHAIDDPFSIDQLRSPRMNASTVRPLVELFYNPKDVSVIYCLLVNRVQFMREQHYQAHYQTVSMTRAILCEILATRILRQYDEQQSGRRGLLLLANVLVTGFDPFQCCPSEMNDVNNPARRWAAQARADYGGKAPAIEVAIVSESKTFLSSAPCQKVMDAIYTGRLVYTAYSFIDILPDHYKHKPIALYDPRKAPLLNQYRLIVPRISNGVDLCQYLLLLALYFLLMTHRDGNRLTIYELLFSIYAFGWVVHEFATILEHGWQVYTQNLWSFLDAGFSIIYGIYLVLRIHGLAVDHPTTNRTALDILTTAAPLLIPRLAFNLMSENILFVSLRDMMADFAVLTGVSAWCFAGFLLSMTWLSDGVTPTITIAKWMLWVWFGLDGTGVQSSTDFHWLLGPILMVTFAFLGNTLFLTILVSMLTNTFGNIVQNATAEIQFRRAVLTLEGVKSDAIFSYYPPLNILALVTLLPLKSIVSPRWFHKVNVTAIRTFNAPLLLLIGVYDRAFLWPKEKKPYVGQKRSGLSSFWDFSRLSVHGDIQAVFDCQPDEVPDSDDVSLVEDDDDTAEEHHQEDRFSIPVANTNGKMKKKKKKKRKSSVAIDAIRKDPFVGGLTEQLSDMLQETIPTGAKERLDELEKSNRRIEEMLGKLLANSVPEDDDEV